ncbi:NifB/NifX family molybdenum-iron cluster-binding protein [Pseudodesulfovibrio sediminis]|uniref:Dinitrogenase iron-molybdenum cofactor biosynthesis protein n=1 Tax=Pseudodesulfovibrio sediminis TaxID=2810563 RepID=A0ABM8I3S6_9BACT|nr:NifB/NifX family molybdenum-iron cluster-binding protein [Pseudodesulfovibrio sediminis]BCS89070.1 dinitrogenase iron-molybdenum cofactor biosynthesis protein [Pseudodesulfovibrio sediminis]
MNTRIAVPTAEPGGMEANIDAHFGHCAMYTLVDVVDGQVKDVQTVPSCPHEQGGCMAPVNYLADNKVKALISGGMGMRPLMGFNQVGIEVYHGSGAPTVNQAIQAFLLNSLPVFTVDQTCGGGQ